MDQRDNELLATLELNEELTNFVREELEGGRSFVDYLRWLVKRDRWNRIKKVIAHLIGEGIESGPAEPLTADYWTRIIPGFIARDSKKLIGESGPISCRPMVSEDLKTLLEKHRTNESDTSGNVDRPILRTEKTIQITTMAKVKEQSN